MSCVAIIGPTLPGQHCLPRRGAGCCSFTIGLSYDFGARNYLPALPRWSAMDPLAEKYYSVSPYVYCAGNPVNLVDEGGSSTRVKRLPDGTFEVVIVFLGQRVMWVIFLPGIMRRLMALLGKRRGQYSTR